MNAIDFRLYLQSVRQAACDAQRARDALLEARDRLTKPSSAHSDGTHVTLGCVNRDVMTNRVESYQCARESAGRKLHECLEVLQPFKEELSSSPIIDRGQRALWLRYVCGMSFESVGDELEVSASTAWRLVRDAERVLGESMGVVDATKR